MTQSGVLLIGTGKTGTTFISKSIQAAFPGSNYLLEPRSVGQIENAIRTRPFAVVKILYPHWAERLPELDALALGQTTFRPSFRIGIVRDPRDRFVSALMYKPFNFVMRGADDGKIAKWIAVLEQKEQDPSSLSLHALIEHMNEIFSRSITFDQEFIKYNRYADWLDRQRNNFCIVRYEDFVDRKISGLESYLGVELPKQADVGGLTRVRRTSSYGNWKQFALAEDIPEMQRLSHRNNSLYGYDDWELPVQPEIIPEFCSRYVKRITDEAKAMRGQAGRPGRNPP